MPTHDSAAEPPQCAWFQLPGGMEIALPDDLSCPSTYVLVEQRRWFEREVSFLGRCVEAGSSCVDVGANFGIYSLALARAVGASGSVFSFEPGAEPRTLLLRSRERNGFDQLRVSACALSDTARDGWLLLGHSSEYNVLGAAPPADGQAAERVVVSTLDRELAQARVDVVKIDAEGEERRILRGAGALLDRCSPLVMYEIRNESMVDSGAREELESRGFVTYRLLGDASCLVPLGTDAVDAMELNLFALRSDRAARLARRGLVAEGRETWALAPDERRQALAALLARPYAVGLGIEAADVENSECAEALLAHVAFTDLQLSAERRLAAIRFAFERLDELCRQAPSATRLASLARVAADFGWRSQAAAALVHPQSVVGCMRAMKAGSATNALSIDEVFLPANPRYDFIFDADRAGDWLISASLEQIEICSKYSGRFAQSSGEALEWLCGQPFASAEMHRRLVLQRLLAGESVVADGGGDWLPVELDLLRRHGALVVT